MPPVDVYTVEEVRPVGARKKYRLMVNGYDTVLNLTENEQQKLYPEAVLVGPPAAPAAKQRSTPNKARAAVENK